MKQRFNQWLDKILDDLLSAVPALAMFYIMAALQVLNLAILKGLGWTSSIPSMETIWIISGFITLFYQMNKGK